MESNTLSMSSCASPDIAPGGFQVGMPEYLVEQDQALGRASHQLVDVPSESFAEGMRGECPDRQPIPYPEYL